MKLSIEWLSQWVSLDGQTPKACADALTLSGSKTETVTCPGDAIRKVVVGHVLSIEKHPDADRLNVCRVDIGGENPLQIITAATNVTVGVYVPVATDGALLPDGTKIKKGKMRGLVSEGMLCGGNELGLTEADEPGAGVDGILLLDPHEAWTPGQDIGTALSLNDTTLDFEITNNRPDCLSVLGLARETAATLRRPLQKAALDPVKGEGDIRSLLNVTVEDPRLCPRYSAAMVQNVAIRPSPRWMRRRLRACGVRPINNIVDITNYVMLEYGQPMHAFDYACLEGGALIVRSARPGEVLETLDGNKRELDETMLVIADPRGATAVAGVMGGAASEITDRTATIVFESANFNGPSVRKTALALSMRTDASSRFEKGLDMSTTITALQRACMLVNQLEAGQVVGGIVDVSEPLPAPVAIPFTPEKINAHLGTDIPPADMLDTLQTLDFTVANGVITVPSFRSDVTLWNDIAEEVARLYGYDRIPVTLSQSKTQGWLTEPQRFRNKLHSLCTALGFDEMLSYSFIGSGDYDKIHLPADSDLRKGRTLLNPLGAETSVMRTTALPSLLTALARNTAVRNPEARLYELCTVYPESGERLPHETPHLILGGYGKDMDFAALKGAAEALLHHLSVKAVFAPGSHPSYHPGRCALLTVRGQEIGLLGEIHPLVAKAYDMAGRVCACELNAELLQALRSGQPKYKALPRYPSIVRDLALVCDKSRAHADILALITKKGGKLLEACALFDVYTDAKLGEDKKSMAYTLTFRAPDRTLLDTEIDEIIGKILTALENQLHINIRA